MNTSAILTGTDLLESKQLSLASLFGGVVSQTSVPGLVDVPVRGRVKNSTIVDSDFQCIKLIQGGDGHGLNMLMEKHAENLHRFIFRYTNNTEDAADLTQETFVRVFQKAQNFKPKATVKTWIYTIALNLCRDRGRRSALVNWVPFLNSAKDDDCELGVEDTASSDQPNPRDSTCALELDEVIAKEIANLPDSVKAPFTLCVLEGLSQAEVAELLKLTVKSVEVKVYRARQQLRKALAPFLKEIDFS